MPSSHVTVAAAILLAGCAGPHFDLRATPAATVTGPSEHALAVVRIKAPWYAPHFMIVRRLRAAVPEYEAIARLETKYFTISDDRKFGGIYVWTTRADADAFYDAKWRSGVRERRGVDPDVLVLDAPFAIQGRAAIQGDALGARSVDYPATATLVLWAAASSEAAAGVADHLKEQDGLIRGHVVVGPGRVGFVGLWTTRAHAEAALSPERLRDDVAELGLSAPELTYFDAPVLIDASLRPGP